VATAQRGLGRPRSRRYYWSLSSPPARAPPTRSCRSARLKDLEREAKSGALISRLGSTSAIEKEVAAANAMLGQLKAESSAAIKALEAEAKAANVTAEQLAQLQFWTRFSIKLTAAADRISGAMAAWVESIHTMLRAPRAAPRLRRRPTRSRPPPCPDGCVKPASAVGIRPHRRARNPQ
jgi:hypothetical protein